MCSSDLMVLAMKSGLDPALSYKVLTDGAGNSRMFQVRGPMMVKGDYSSDVTMKLAVWQKDMNVIADFATANGCPTPVFAATRSGRISIEGQPDRQWAISTGSSAIDVAVASPPVTLDATTGSGSVQVTGADVNGTVSKRAVNGAIGSGGPPVRLSTRSGSIRVNVGR